MRLIDFKIKLKDEFEKFEGSFEGDEFKKIVPNAKIDHHHHH